MKKYLSVFFALLLLASLFVPSSAEDELYYSYQPSWKLSVNSENLPIERAFDGDVSTFWHSAYTAEGSTITSHDEVPYEITVVFPEALTISGFVYTPRPEGMSDSGRALSYNFYIAATDTSELVLAMSGDFENDSSVKTVRFPCNVPVKKIVFEITEAVRGYGTMSEMQFLKPKQTNDLITVEEFLDYQKEHLYYAIPKNGMRATAESYWQETTKANRVLDDNTGTFWHEKPGDKAPIYLDMDMGAVYDVLGFTYVPRNEPENKGQWKKYNVYASTDNENFELVLEEATMQVKYQEVTEFFLEPVTARYFRFEILDFNYHCACAELMFYESAKDKRSRDEEKHEVYVLQIDNPVMKVTKGTSPERAVTLDVAPYLDNGTTMIPLRGLLTEMGAEIAWDGDTQSIDVATKEIQVEFQIMNTRAYVTDNRYGRVRYTLKGSAPKIKQDRTFIPLRFVSENLGYLVTWDGETKTITITTKEDTQVADVNN